MCFLFNKQPPLVFFYISLLITTYMFEYKKKKKPLKMTKTCVGGGGIEWSALF